MQQAASGASDIAAMKVAHELSALARPLPEAVEVWRGVRSTIGSFGTAAPHLEDAIGRQWIEQRFMSTTLNYQLAASEFVKPGPHPALLRLNVRAGASAIWVPPLGIEELADQDELLFTPGVGLRILGVDQAGTFPVITVEVTE